MTTPQRPAAAAAQPAPAAAYSSDDAIAQEVRALQDELAQQAGELNHALATAEADNEAAIAAQDAAAIAQVQASEQAVINALRQMAIETSDALGAEQASVADDVKSLDDAERSVANSVGAPARPPVTKP